MSVLQPVWNVEKIAIVLIAIIDTTLNTSNSTKKPITQSEKLSKRSSPENTRDVHAENQDVQKSTANAIRQVCYAEIFVNA